MKGGETNPIFVSSFIDDLGLTPSQFRIYARIARRGDCFESVPSISKGTRLSIKTVRRSIRELEKMELIHCRERPGKSCKIKILPLPKPPLCSLGPTQNDVGAPTQNVAGDPTQNVTDEGNPLKETPLKESPSLVRHSPDVSELVDSAWNNSPIFARNRSSREKVKKEFNRIKEADRPGVEELTSAIKAWSEFPDWIKDNGQFVPGLHIWVKDKKWENLPESPVKMEAVSGKFNGDAGKYNGKGGSWD